MMNLGIPLVLFGFMLWLYVYLPQRATRSYQKTRARIVGYKQFLNNETIRDNSIAVGVNFQWLRVVSFEDPLTHQPRELWTNPGTTNPEPIGTELIIRLKDDNAWIEGGANKVQNAVT